MGRSPPLEDDIGGVRAIATLIVEDNDDESQGNLKEGSGNSHNSSGALKLSTLEGERDREKILTAVPADVSVVRPPYFSTIFISIDWSCQRSTSQDLLRSEAQRSS